MRIVLVFLGLMLITTQSWALSCVAYKTGKFILFEQKGSIHVRIDRTATEQTETDLRTGKYIRFSIRWLNECEYELTLVDGNSDQVGYFRNRRLLIRITDVYADGYRFEGRLQGSNTVVTNILRVL